jgi:hypothetical protein
MNYKSRKYVDLHVIDAVNEEWMKNGASEALMLRFFLRRTSIHIVSHLAWDVNSLQGVIAGVAGYRPQYCDPRKAIPYIHISCYGKKDGLNLGDSALMPWSQLSECLLPLQEKTDYNLPLSLSSCFGYYGAQLAKEISPKYKKRRPYYSLVGANDEIPIGILCDAFGILYYNLLVKFSSLKQSIQAARDKTGVPLGYTYGAVVAG